jgi:hypothetical protein
MALGYIWGLTMKRTAQFILLLFLWTGAMKAVAQPVDAILGLKRARVQQILRPYRILDYQRDRVSYEMEKGVRQTILYVNDTCVSFLWAVNTDKVADFRSSLEAAGYVSTADGSYAKEGMEVTVTALESGKVSVFTARATGSFRPMDDRPLMSTQVGQHPNTGRKGRKRPDRYANVPMRHGEAVVIDLPIMQQEANREKAEGIKLVKDPQRNWVGEAEGSTRFLGWQ